MHVPEPSTLGVIRSLLTNSPFLIFGKATGLREPERSGSRADVSTRMLRRHGRVRADVQAEVIFALPITLWQMGRYLLQALFGYCKHNMITKICWNESERVGTVIKNAIKLKGRPETLNTGSAVEGIF